MAGHGDVDDTIGNTEQRTSQGVLVSASFPPWANPLEYEGLCLGAAVRGKCHASVAMCHASVLA